MQLSKPKWKKSYKTLIPVGCTVVLFVFTIVVMIFSFRDHIIDEKKIHIKELVETVFTILTEYNNSVVRGELPLDEAQKCALQITSKLRYGPEMKDYFWITDMHPHQLMHPYHKAPYGYDLSSYKDTQGNRVFVEFKNIVKKNGSGYHTYYWQWKDNPEKIVPKISYVKGFTPWRWVVGTGVYIEDVNAEIYDFSLKILFTCFLIFILIIFLLNTILTREAKIERKSHEAVQALQKSEERLINITDSVRDAIIDMEPDGCISFWNPASESLTGYSAAEALGRNLHELLMPPKYKDLQEKGFRKFHKTGQGPAIGETTQWEINTKSGRLIPIELSLSQPIQTCDGWRAVGILRDISDRMEAEKALRESEEMFKALAEKSQDIIVRFNKLGEYTYANPMFLKIMGITLENMLYKTPTQIAELFPHLDASPDLITFWEESVRKTVETGKSIRVEFDLNELIFDWILIPEKSHADDVISIMTSARNITETRQLQNQVMQSQKVESIGTLAGGIAHDFNNILYPIIGYTELTMGDVPEGSRTHKNLTAILKAAMRAVDLVQQILTFTRKSGQDHKPMMVSLVVKEALKLLRSSIPSTIDIHQEIDNQCGLIMGDPTQIHQVVMNLCTNAYHAMEDTGGNIEVTLSEKIISVDDPKYEIDLTPGRYILLSVRDTGHGMPPDIVNRIFDPYYTTKKSGKGTGLGLSVTHGIIKNHGGSISVYSEPGVGTTFHVHLPVIEKDANLVGIESPQIIPTGNERILLVDDEKSITDMLKETLTRLGYQVTTRISSVEALEAFRVRFDNFDLVITDMTMPKMTGIELAEQMVKIRKDIPIILCTGFSESINEEKANLIGIQAFVMKPVIMSDLAEKIRDVLDNVKKDLV